MSKKLEDSPHKKGGNSNKNSHRSELQMLADAPRPKRHRCCSTNLYFAAKAYAKIGYSILPLHSVRDGVCTCSLGSSCSSPGKHPLFKGGVHNATNDISLIKRIWRDHPEANIGIATGQVSGIVALDVDPRNGGRKTASRLKNEVGRLPRTVYSDTGGDGYHRLFAVPDVPLITRHAIEGLPGLDVQSDGAYIVAPPSRHASGKRYRWRKGRDPGSLSLAELPEPWLAQLRKPERAVSQAPGKTPSAGTISEGGRSNFLTSRAGALQQAGFSAGALLAALQTENVERCSPPLDEEEVARIAASVGRYPTGTSASGDEAEGVMQTVLNEHYRGGAHLIRPADGQFWAYDGTRWAPLGRQILCGIVLAAIQLMPGRRNQNTASLMQQVMRLIEARVAADGDSLRFNAPPPPVLNCRNGELWINASGGAELRPHSATSYLRHRLEIDSDPPPTCPRYDEAVLGIFAKASEPSEMVGFWHSLMGYAMQPSRPVPLVILGWGTGDNGKTKLLETLVRLLGNDVVMAMPIGELGKSRFTTGSLLGKLAIIDDDVQSGTRLPDGQLKRLSEEKTITGENKYGPPFTFAVRTIIVMLFNNPPSLADLSHGMQRRLIVIPFDRSFSAKEVDRTLFSAIWAEELPGILNHYLAGLQRVIKRGWSFEPPPAAQQAKQKLLQAANPVPAFVAERCEPSDATYIQPLYAAYEEWAKAAGITMVPQRLAFQRQLENLGYKTRHGNKGTKVMGLKLRPEPPAAWPPRPKP